MDGSSAGSIIPKPYPEYKRWDIPEATYEEKVRICDSYIGEGMTVGNLMPIEELYAHVYHRMRAWIGIPF